MPLVFALGIIAGCARKPIPLPPPPKPVQLTATTTNYSQAQTHVLKGWYHAHREEWERSRESFLLAIHEDPDHPWAYIQLGHAENQYGHTERARNAWREAKQRLLPEEIELHAQLNQLLEENPSSE